MESGGFNENDRRWYCACGTHCEKGTYIIGVVNIVLGVLGIAFGNIIFGVIQCIFGVLLVIAVQRKDRALVWPSIVCLWIEIVVLVITMVVCLIFAIVSLVAAGDSNDTHNTTVAASTLGGVLLGIAVFCGIFLGLNTWFLKVINQYRSFLNEREQALNPRLTGSAQATYTVATTTTIPYLQTMTNSSYQMMPTYPSPPPPYYAAEMPQK